MSWVCPTSPAQAPRKARGCVTMPRSTRAIASISSARKRCGRRQSHARGARGGGADTPGGGGKGAMGGERADVAAKARLLAPDRHKHRRRHAKALLDL